MKGKGGPIILFPLLLFVCDYFHNFFLSFVFLGPHPRHMEVPRLGVESELQLLAYATATAAPDLSCVCDLHHSSWQRWILNPRSEARDRTCNLRVPSQIRCPLGHTGGPHCSSILNVNSLHLLTPNSQSSHSLPHPPW